MLQHPTWPGRTTFRILGLVKILVLVATLPTQLWLSYASLTLPYPQLCRWGKGAVLRKVLARSMTSFWETSWWAHYQNPAQQSTRTYRLDVSLSSQDSYLETQECAAHGRHGNSWVSLLEFSLAYASLPSCPNMPGDLVVLVVTLDKLVRLRKRIRSSTIVSGCSCVWLCVCVLLLACCVCFHEWLMRESCAHYLPLCVYCLLNGVVTCHCTPHWQAPPVLNWVQRVHNMLLFFLIMKLILLSCDLLRALNVTLRLLTMLGYVTEVCKLCHTCKLWKPKGSFNVTMFLWSRWDETTHACVFGSCTFTLG